MGYPILRQTFHKLVYVPEDDKAWLKLPIFSPLWVLYGASRVYLVLGPFLLLRLVPLGVYEIPRWLLYVPQS
jgi:hypothetical protein